MVRGLYGSAKAMIVAECAGNKQDDNNRIAEERQIHFVIEDTKEAAEYFCADLYSLFRADDVYFFPTSTATAKSVSIKDSSNKVLRSIALSAISGFKENDGNLTGGKNIIIVSYPDAVKEGIPSPSTLKKSILHLTKNEEVPFDSIKEILLEDNFERVDYVEQPGQFAIRGSIIDIFSYSNDKPYRLDFFGDTLESIKIFDIETQRSTSEVDSFDVFPNIYSTLLGDASLKSSDDISIFDYLPSECSVVWNNTFEKFFPLFKGKKVVNLLGKSWEGIEENALYLEYHCSPQPSFNKNFLLLAEDIIKRNSEGYKVYISSSSKDQIERLTSIFSDAALSQSFLKENTPKFEPLYYSLHEGFVCSDEGTRVCVYTDHQIFERYHRVKIKREVTRSERLTLEDLNSYHVGDYIVHIDHGVGIFGGLAKTQVNGKMQEVVKLMYKDGDVIFLSVHSLHKIAKYKSADGIPPKIYKLGSGAWNRLKQNTKSKIKDIAKDLIALYSKRKQAQGFAFAPDGYMQKELEASFMWDDTPDQISATEDVKTDMERGYPMDRLICGDVGFGKTEVAVRAAFKAVCDSKQVCILVPTTILALQHYKTFTERLEKFPVNIDYVSRLRTAREISEVQKNIKSGKIDIIIGTHRLLNKNIEFKDLGLLIIDEEQKFGVAAKERLRELKVEVDTLTLTATPIPRTLQFSLLGARDLSIINTPPPNRLPVQTEIIDFKEEYIKQAIENELNRGGQVFFVHNRVEDILSVEQMINRICPNAKTVVGHGKMESKTLENRILEFIRGDYDILICTTIIENGIDIPNANTMIINQAHRFGLSDLHQLRGRVGRSNVKAYCYLEGLSYIGKVVVRPVNEADYGLHIGGAVMYDTPKTSDEMGFYGGTRFSCRNATNISRKKYLDTDDIKNTKYNLIATAELAGHYEGLRLESAWLSDWTYMDPEKVVLDKPYHFQGWYVEGGVLLFGGKQSYDSGSAKFNRVRCGESWGDAELAFKYEFLNLNDYEGRTTDQAIFGGSAELYGVGLNFYFAKNVKIALNYQYVNNDRYANGKGKLNCGLDADGNATKDYTNVVAEAGDAGVNYHMLLARFQVAF